MSENMSKTCAFYFEYTVLHGDRSGTKGAARILRYSNRACTVVISDMPDGLSQNRRMWANLVEQAENAFFKILAERYPFDRIVDWVMRSDGADGRIESRYSIRLPADNN
jgi:hypothetical protein